MPYDRAVIEQALDSLRQQCPDRAELLEVIDQSLGQHPKMQPPVADLEARCCQAMKDEQLRVKMARYDEEPADFRFLHLGRGGVPVNPMSAVLNDLGGAIHRLVKYGDWGDSSPMYTLFYNLVWHALNDADWQHWVEYFRLCAEGNWPIGYSGQALYVVVGVDQEAAAA